jgi:hypothetical protein
MCVEGKDHKKKKATDDDLSESSEDEDDDDEDFDDVEYRNKLKDEKRKMFEEEEILDIEEAQDKNAFADVINDLEDNYLEIDD